MIRVVNKEAFQDVVRQLSGLSANAVYWENDGVPFVGDQDRAVISMTLKTLDAVAVDEHRRDLGPPGYPVTAFVTTEIGNREVFITLRAETFDKTVEAGELLDQIRTGIRAEGVRDQLNAISLAYEWSSKTIVMPTVVDQRIVSAAAADFRFGGIGQLVSSIQNNQGWISTVNNTNTIPGTVTP
jgi:hypothetical protein